MLIVLLASLNGLPTAGHTRGDKMWSPARRSTTRRSFGVGGSNCEDLPCVCSTQVGGDGRGHESEPEDTCAKPLGVQRLRFSAGKYPNTRRHFRSALMRAWPRRLVLNRPGADDAVTGCSNYPAREGKDGDEYPPALGPRQGQGRRAPHESAQLLGRRALRRHMTVVQPGGFRRSDSLRVTDYHEAFIRCDKRLSNNP
jgi:hypothetical protein